MRRSRQPYLCFVHEDVRFVTQDWGRKIVAHLQDKEVGLVGIAGGGTMPKIPLHVGIGRAKLQLDAGQAG